MKTMICPMHKICIDSADCCHSEPKETRAFVVNCLYFPAMELVEHKPEVEPINGNTVLGA